nr:hypothetical protein [Eggerthella sinensis]
MRAARTGSGLPDGGRTGNLRFYSYRDPHLDETLERSRRVGVAGRVRPGR